MPADFLLQQMEWREAIGEATEAADAAALDHLANQLRHAIKALLDELGQQLDQRHDYAGAAGAVRKLRFFDRLREEINNALEALET
jgi:molecular chaperone HscB